MINDVLLYKTDAFSRRCFVKFSNLISCIYIAIISYMYYYIISYIFYYTIRLSNWIQYMINNTLNAMSQ